MLTRRNFIKRFSISFFGFILSIPFVSTLWGQVKKILPKGFKREELKNMNPAEIDNRNLDINPLEKFETMGPTDVAVDGKTYRLKITGAVNHPLSLSYDQILKFPSLTEPVLLICPGFFANNGRWTGVSLKTLLQEARVKKEATYLDIKGANEKGVRIPLKDLDRKKIFLAYRVNGETLPQKHGFPLRLVYEDAYGYDWVKYVEEVVVS
jgi:DMSO/TMAO reductase YedYZ molybdopterin-dependent catalytic subunit